MPKTPGLNLPYGIDPVNAVPVDSNYGPYASLAAAKAAIVLALRYDGLTVKINGLGEYWWLQADLTDTGLIAKSTGGGSVAPIPITYAALLALQVGGTLSPGTTYKITDRDLGIYITAVSTTEFNTRGVRTMLTPKFDAIANPTLLGVWYNWIDQWIIPINIGDTVIWGGLVWASLTGVTGTATSDILLDAINWVLVPKGAGADINYGVVTHDVEYDVIQDLVTKQWDNLGNIVGPITRDEESNFGFNPCSITSWLAFKDINYTWNGGTWGDWHTVCYNNTFKYGFYNVSNVDQLSAIVNIIRDNEFNYFKNLGIFEGALIERNYNCSFYNLQGSYFSYTNDNVNVKIHDCSLLAFTPIDTSFSSDCEFYICNGGIFLSNSKRIRYDTAPGAICTSSEDCSVFGPTTLGGISNSKNVYIGTGNYGNITNVIFEDVQFVVPAGGTIENYKAGVEKIVYQYVEFVNVLLAGVPQYYGRIIKPNSRLIDAVIVSSYVVNSGAPTLEFGVETDAVAYMPLTLVSTLLTTPQKINTISGVLTVGKRFYAKIATLSGSVQSSPTPYLRVWVKMITY